MTAAIYILQYDEVILTCTDQDLGYDWNDVYWTTALWSDRHYSGIAHYAEQYPFLLPGNWIVQ